MLRTSSATAPGWVLTTSVWAITGFALYVLGGMISLLAIALAGSWLPAGMQPEVGSLSWSVRNGLQPALWGVLAASASMVLGRRLVAGIRFRPDGWLVLAIGIGLAAWSMFLVNENVRVRYGVYDAEYAGLAWFASPAVLAIALAAWATLAVPPGQGIVLAITCGAAVAGLGASLLPSVPSAIDGIDADHVMLAAAFLADLAYAAVIGVIIAARLLRRVPNEREPAPG